MQYKVKQFKGYPVLDFTVDENKPFSFGVKKARLILDHIELIQRFLDENENNRPRRQSRRPRYDSTAQDSLQTLHEYAPSSEGDSYDRPKARRMYADKQVKAAMDFEVKNNAAETAPKSQSRAQNPFMMD